jgi:hypothetical protein
MIDFTKPIQTLTGLEARYLGEIKAGDGRHHLVVVTRTDGTEFEQRVTGHGWATPDGTYAYQDGRRTYDGNIQNVLDATETPYTARLNRDQLVSEVMRLQGKIRKAGYQGTLEKVKEVLRS